MTSESKFRFPCPQCGKSIVVLSEHAGRRGKCPRCQTLVKVPVKTIQASVKPLRESDMMGPASPMTEQEVQDHIATNADEMRASFRCPECGKEIEVLPQHSGKPGQCPICDALLRFPTMPTQNSFGLNKKSKVKGSACVDSSSQGQITTAKEAIEHHQVEDRKDCNKQERMESMGAVSHRGEITNYIKFSCSNCGRHLKVKAHMAGEKIDCSGCGECCGIHSNQRKDNQQTQVPVTETRDQELAGHLLSRDLTEAIKYVPSGMCDHTGKLFTVLPLSVLASIAGAAIGSVVGGVVLWWVTLLKAVLWDIFVIEPGQVSMQVVAIAIGLFLGAGFGFYFGLMFTLAFANRRSHNRSRALAGVYACSVVLTVLSLYGAVWFLFSPYQELGAWRYVGLGVLLLSGVLASIHGTRFNTHDTIYCEACHSFLKHTHTVKLAIPAKDLLELGRKGNIDDVRSLPTIEQSKTHTRVSFHSCPGACVGFLTLSQSILKCKALNYTPYLGTRDEAKKRGFGEDFDLDSQVGEYDDVFQTLLKGARVPFWISLIKDIRISTEKDAGTSQNKEGYNKYGERIGMTDEELRELRRKR